MLVIFAVIIGGIVTGRLLSSRRLAFVSRVITVIIWLLLFLLGLEVGSDPAVVGGMATLGRTAFVVFAFSVAGSIGASWLLWRYVRRVPVFRGDGGENPRHACAPRSGAVAPESARPSGIPGQQGAASCGTGLQGQRATISCGTDLSGQQGAVSRAAESSGQQDMVSSKTEPSGQQDTVSSKTELAGQRDAAPCTPEPSEPGAATGSGAKKTAQNAAAGCGQIPGCPAGEPASAGDGLPLSMWSALRGSLVIVAFFVAGCIAGLLAVMPFDVAGSRVSTYVLYALMFCVGITLGHDTTLAGRVRQLDPRLALLPVMTAVGTLAGAALATPLLHPLLVGDTLAVGAGFGYYSLSSIFIADLRGAELGTVALLCNVMREIFTLLAAPLVARWFGPLAAVSIGGATTFDTTLPIITQAAGKPYVVVSIFHGCVLDLSVPFLVTFFCTI